MLKTLADLLPNTKAIIHSVPNEDLSIKLMEMGFIPGEPVLLEMVAPLGDPLSVIIGGANWSIRKSEAEQILVESI